MIYEAFMNDFHGRISLGQYDTALAAIKAAWRCEGCMCGGGSVRVAGGWINPSYFPLSVWEGEREPTESEIAAAIKPIRDDCTS